MRRLIVAECTLLVLFSTVHLCAQNHELKLDVEPLKIGNEEVRFRASLVDEEPHPAKMIGESRHYQLYSTSEIATYDALLQQFSYDLFVKRVSSTPPEWTCFRLIATSAYQLPDQ